MSVDLKKLTEKVDSYAKSVISQKRYEHSVRTAEMCALLCTRYGLNPESGYLSGIAHDMCKEAGDEKILELASKDGFEITELERNHVSLLHGRAAAVFLEDFFDFHDPDVLAAVAWHTFGNTGLCDLGKLLFVADKIEPGRPQSTDEYRDNLMKKELNDLTLSVLCENIDYLNAHGKAVADISLKMRDELLAGMKAEGGGVKI